MSSVHLSSVLIKPNRQRQDFDPEAIQELKNSIEDRGLLHAPVLRREEGTWVLVAGERRMRAIAEIFELGGTVRYNGQVFESPNLPYTDIGELTTLEAEEAELDENLKRRDLTWQEHAEAVARLHSLRQAQVDAIRITHQAPETRPAPHTVADTARELTGRSDGSFQDTVRKEIIVARHLANPAIAKAKSADEAFKILKREEEREKNQKLAAEIGKSFSASAHTALNVNCIEYMSDPANHGQFDVILTDPPYGMGAQDFGDAGGKLLGIEHHYDDSYESWKKLMLDWTSLSYLCAKPQAHAYVFCDIDNFHELKKMMEFAGWYVFRTPFTVHKLNSGRVPLPEMGPRRQTEWLLYAIKGKKPVTHIYADIIAVNGDDNLGHGAQKPVALYQNLLQRSVRPGDRILDSFCGSGTIFPAAHTYKCSAVGLELSPESFGITLKRLQDLAQADEILDFPS